MKILSVNAGSSSLKFQLLQMPEEFEIRIWFRLKELVIKMQNFQN